MTFDPNPPTVPVPVPSAPVPFTPGPPEPYAIPTGPVTTNPPIMAPAPALPAATRGSGGGWLNVVLIIAAAVAIGGVAFAVGRSTAPASAVAANGRANLGNGAALPGGNVGPRASGQPGFGRGSLGGGFGGGFGGGPTITGTVESANGDTMTIRTASGQTIEVTTGPSTTYHTQSAATASDIQSGRKVQVQLDFGGQGRPNANGGPAGSAASVTVIP